MPGIHVYKTQLSRKPVVENWKTIMTLPGIHVYKTQLSRKPWVENKDHYDYARYTCIQDTIEP